MQQASRYIIFTGMAICCISSLYFLSLLFSVPILVAVPVIMVALFFLFKWLIQGRNVSDDEGFPVWTVSLLIAGLGIMTATAVRIATKHGEWDAWGMWNLHAKYMADPHHWQNLFLNTDNDHPDYPLCLPALQGFIIRLCSGQFSVVIPFVFSLLITLCIPALIYAERAKKNLMIAFVVLFFFSRDEFYIARGVSQYADTLVAFFFLCAFVCIDYATENRKYILLSAFCLASCAWTKNEGIVLAVLFLLFYANVFFTLSNLKYTAMGLAGPVIMVLIQKMDLYGSNDLLTGGTRPLINNLWDKGRWDMIWTSFTQNLDKKFYWIKISMYIYALACLVQRKLPGRAMLLLLTCVVGSLLVYVFTPRDLNWHLITSQDRLMHQVMPAFVYVLAKFADIKLLRVQQPAS